MLSNKLTFSLTSLLVLLFIGLCLPAMAQTAQVLPQPITVGSGNTAIPAGTIPVDGIVVYGQANTGDVMIDGTGSDDTVGARYTEFPGLQADLHTFFGLGGTIELVVQKASPIAKHKLVISEILWGSDASGGTSDNPNVDIRQWIELQNLSSEALTITGTDGANPVYILFTPFARATGDTADGLAAATSDAAGVAAATRVKPDDATATHRVIDRVSTVNLNAFGNITGTYQLPGQSGNLAAATTVAPQVPLISAQRLADLGKGVEAGGWAATAPITRRNVTSTLIQANPGVGRVGIGIPVAGAPTAAPAANKLVINEVRNHSNDDLDWIEVKNVSASDVQLENWELSYTTKHDEDVDIVDFPKYNLGPQGILLVVNRDPSETELAGGVNLEVMIDTNAEQLQKGATHLYLDAKGTLKLPNSGDYLLLLRSAHDKNKTHEAIQDAAGSAEISHDFKGDRSKETKVWPFHAYGSMGGDKVGSFGQVDGNRSAWERKPKGVTTGVYTIDNINGRHKGAWNKVMGSTTRGVGYDRGVDLNYAPGTPGYENMIANTVDDYVSTQPDPDGMEIDAGLISISEVMFDAGPRWNLVQWIELYNASMTQAVDIAGWELEIRNAKDDVESYVDSVFTFEDNANTVILPNQTLLIVSGAGTNDVAPNRIYNLYEHHRRALGLTTRRSVLLSPTGFYLKLTDRADLDRDSRADKDVTVDEAGNVMVDGAQRIIQWPLPDVSDDGQRKSIVRQYGKRYTPQGGQDPANVRYQPSGGEMANTGNPTMAEVDASPNGSDDFWRESDIVGAGISFYGHRDDISTPGYRTGGPLPVSLSSFRPVRNKDTGEVTIRWITQSELNNAGFNILRSETRDGQFKVVNLKGLIAGHGTTSEQHVYEWKDTTATKPNVVYYYQIEDVSLDGKHTTLMTTHLKGIVSAAGKLTTTWGDLKDRK